MKIFIDKNICIECGSCNCVCPNFFEMDDDGFAKASANEIADNLVESSKDAESKCPVNAITVK